MAGVQDAVSPAPSGVQRAWSRWRAPFTPWLWIGLAILFVAIFLVWPVIDTIVLSLKNSDSSIFVGLANYVRIFTDPSLLLVLRNNVLWLVLRNVSHVNELSCRRGQFSAGDHLQAPLPRSVLSGFDAALGCADPGVRRKRLFAAVLECAAGLAETAAREPGKVSSPLSAEFLDELLEYIGRNYRKPLKLGDLSEIARLSPAYFSTVFKKQVGVSFKEYLTGVRVAAAQELLGKTNRSVAEVALAVGYEDPFYFSRAFKKATGRAPSAWRANLVSTFFTAVSSRAR